MTTDDSDEESRPLSERVKLIENQLAMSGILARSPQSLKHLHEEEEAVHQEIITEIETLDDRLDELRQEFDEMHEDGDQLRNWILNIEEETATLSSVERIAVSLEAINEKVLDLQERLDTME